MGILIHVTRWSRPDIMNAVREATKHMQASTPAHKRYVNVLIGFLTRTKNRKQGIEAYANQEMGQER